MQRLETCLLIAEADRVLCHLHGEQFRTVSGSMNRLTLSLINRVKTLEITTKQLKSIILHILKQKQIRKKTKT